MATIKSAEYSVRKPKMARQPASARTQPPMMGAMAGASANIMALCAISRCAAGPSATSRTTARLTTMPAPPLIPCRARASHRCSMVVANMTAREASMNTASAATTTARRPKRSDRAPCHRDMSANGSR